MIRSQQMYVQARAEAEPQLVSILKSMNLKDVFQTSSADDVRHIDVTAVNSQGIQLQFDVKDLSPRYLTSRNYNMSAYMLDDYRKHPEAYKHHMVACREYSTQSKPTGRFIIASTSAAAHCCCPFNRRDDGTLFFLFNIDEVIDRYPKACRIIGPAA